MKITFPHMGTLSIPLETIFESLKFQVILPPKTTTKTIKLGSQYAPEQICLPFKLNLGNLIEAYKRGADTMVMIGGCGPCRFGYYGSLLYQILNDLGIDYKFINFDENIFKTIKNLKKINKLSWLEIYNSFRLGWNKLKLLEQLDERACFIRPSIDTSVKQLAFEQKITGTQLLIQTATTLEELKIIYNKFPQPCSDNDTYLKVILVGDIFTILEPASNYYIERELGKRGVIVLKKVKVSSWLKTSLVGFERSLEGKEIIKNSRPYLKHPVGGHGLHSIGTIINNAKTKKADGIIHIMPFSCTPEIVAASIFPKLTMNNNIPLLRVVIDEHAGDAALITRLEAFIDLIYRKNYKQA